MAKTVVQERLQEKSCHSQVSRGEIETDSLSIGGKNFEQPENYMFNKKIGKKRESFRQPLLSFLEMVKQKAIPFCFNFFLKSRVSLIFERVMSEKVLREIADSMAKSIELALQRMTEEIVDAIDRQQDQYDDEDDSFINDEEDEEQEDEDDILDDLVEEDSTQGRKSRKRGRSADK